MDETMKYIEIAELLCCSIMTARRKIGVMRRELGLPKYSRLTREQVTSYFRTKK